MAEAMGDELGTSLYVKFIASIVLTGMSFGVSILSFKLGYITLASSVIFTVLVGFLLAAVLLIPSEKEEDFKIKILKQLNSEVASEEVSDHYLSASLNTDNVLLYPSPSQLEKEALI